MLAIGTNSRAPQRQLPHLGLLLFLPFGLLTLSTCQIAEAAPSTIEVNGSGSLLGTAISGSALPSTGGAVTMSSSDISQTTFRQAEITGGSHMAWEPSAFAPTETNAAPQTPTAALFNPGVSPNLLALDEAGTYGDITQVPELSTWVAALLAAGVLLFSARNRFARGCVSVSQNR